jgi:hypothetical protein
MVRAIYHLRKYPLKKWLAFILAALIVAVIHEGAHALFATMFGEYEAFHIRPFGMEVTVKTPVDERSGFQWFLISGTSNFLTLALGYVLLVFGNRFAGTTNAFVKACVYYTTFLSLLLDPLNLSIGPFIYGGDATGVAVGLGINQNLIQLVFFLILLANREIIAQKLLPMYNVKTEHLLLRPWFRLKKQLPDT